MSNQPVQTVDAAVARALSAYAVLTELGEEVEDEWSYVTDLSTAWCDRFDAVTSTRGNETIAPEVDGAIDRVIDEIDRVTDAHRAIDWLSTFPQVVLLALGETP